jgi:HD-GYP domain-containing protein (c-di-GMP phosphodiesterase class II)
MPVPSHSPLVLERLCVHARAVLGVDEAAVFAREDGARDELTVLAAAGTGAAEPGHRVPAAGGLAGLAMSSGQPLYVPEHDRTELRATASAPVALGRCIVGALSVSMRTHSLRLGLRQLELLGGLADLVGKALQHGERQPADPVTAIRELASELETADPQTSRHSDEVSRLAVRVGRALGMSGVELLELELGARLHDVGKLRVPPAILQKPGPLTDPEREVMRLHATWGAELVAEIPGLEAVALIVRLHHERFDGHGYPDGLAGERIPLASRVLAACDAYGAMTSDRPYRSALARPAALRELARCAEAQFEGRVCDELKRCLAASGRLGRPRADDLFPQDLDDEALRPASVELGVEDLLPGT